jgi:hypothetical protein
MEGLRVDLELDRLAQENHLAVKPEMAPLGATRSGAIAAGAPGLRRLGGQHSASL